MSTAAGMTPPTTWEPNGWRPAPAEEVARAQKAAEDRVGYYWGRLEFSGPHKAWREGVLIRAPELGAGRRAGRSGGSTPDCAASAPSSC